MNKFILNLVILTLTLIFACQLSAKTGPSKTYQEIDEIVNSTEFSKQEKIDKICTCFDKMTNWSGILYRLDKIDKEQTKNIALQLFRKKGTSQLQRFETSRYLLEQADTEFKHEYKEFLIGTILNGGEEEFCKPRVDDYSAIGEYAGIAGGINRPKGITFDEVADQSVIPILIRCLDAPDNVYPENQGHVIEGKPGESTGRNTQRQGIPLALAKLHATTATKKLQEVLFTHPDYYLRYNSAYALAIIMPRQESLIIEQRLLDTEPDKYFNFPSGKRPIKHFLFPFGKGLIEKEMYEGIKYMSFEYAYQPNDFSPAQHALYA